jgi:alpha-mannosidase
MKRHGYPGRVLLFNNGCDHMPAQPQVPELIDYCNRRLPDARLVQGTFGDYAEALRAQRLRLRRFQGELHEGKHQYLLSGVFSARTYLKEANCRATVALERVAEPAAALGWLSGAAWPGRELAYAWKELLKNQPHDDVCGCSVDAVHQDDLARARHVGEVCAGLAEIAARRLAAGQVDTSVGARLPDAPAVLVVNTLGRQRGARVAVKGAAVPKGFEPACGGLVAEDGRPVPGSWKLAADGGVEVSAFCPEIPALGWRVLQLAREVHRDGELRADRRRLTLENRHLRVAAAPDGTVSVTEKASGRTWRKLGFFEDREDDGDSYDYSPLARSPRPITSLRSRARWTVIEDGGVCVALRGAVTMRVPAEMAADRRCRSARQVPLRLALTVSLLPGARRADFEVEFENIARDHRLRLAFPTGCRARTIRAASPFDLVERPVRVRPRPDYHQPPVPTKHCDGLVTASGGGCGAAVFTEGLHEYEAAPERGQVVLYVTLLRAFGWLSRGGFVTRKSHAGPGIETPEGQALRPHRLRLAFRPHRGLADEPALFGERDEFLAGPIAQACAPRAARGAARAGWLELAPAALALTAVKRAEERNSLVVRFFNPGRRPERARMILGFAAAEAHLATLAEARVRRLPVKDGGRLVECACGPRQIVSVEIVPAAPRQDRP